MDKKILPALAVFSFVFLSLACNLSAAPRPVPTQTAPIPTLVQIQFPPTQTIVAPTATSTATELPAATDTLSAATLGIAVTNTRPPAASVTAGPILPTAPPTLTPVNPGGPPLASRAKIFLIAKEDGGASGKKIGCNDSVVGVDVDFTPTAGVLRASLDKLLAIKTADYGQSGLYNALYQSNLSIDSLIIQDKVATLRLKGTLASGGVCDDPRIKAQLEETALQFATVSSVKIFVNDKPIEDVLSGKGS